MTIRISDLKLLCKQLAKRLRNSHDVQGIATGAKIGCFVSGKAQFSAEFFLISLRSFTRLATKKLTNDLPLKQRSLDSHFCYDA